jgi:hypothetical protein
MGTCYTFHNPYNIRNIEYEEDSMRYPLIIGLIWLVTVPAFSLEYVESSSGLATPEMEGGRTELEMVDINDDGNIDILSIGDHGSPYINTDEHGIMVWFGDGMGNWSVYQNGAFGYGGICVGDVNNDGFMDVGYGMHHNYSSTDFGDSILEVALGDGTGQNWMPWDDGISIADPNQWGMFCTDFADINNDGFLDLGSNAFGYDDGVHIFLNNGDGTWTQVFGFLGGNSTMDFVFGDVNADGNTDFVAAHQYGSVYLGDGTGGFSLADGNLPQGGNSGRVGPSLGDVNNDGRLDLAFRNSDGGVEVWAWQGSNTWVDVSGTLPSSGPYYGTQLWDMDCDGFMDVAAYGDVTVTVWCGDGAGTWTQATTMTLPDPGGYAAFRVGADADHNGFPDMVLVNEEEGADPWNPVNTPHFFKETSLADSLSIRSVFPRGSEKFVAGSVNFIRWTCAVPAGDTALVRLELSTDGSSGPWSEIRDSLASNDRYQWSIPSDIASNNCFVRYAAFSASDTSIAVTPAAFTIALESSIREQDDIPASMQLRVSPSVFLDGVMLQVTVPDAREAVVRVYDSAGRLIKKLLHVFGSGSWRFVWDRTDHHEEQVPAGVYYVYLEVDGKSVSQKIVLMR